ncbi:MAG: ABC transporter [Acidobacteria bacterium]|nr:MAG: ABC transporter [Acidobacteriota bacterium]PYV00308.1 MAG: ABC transporter [Acidobacteriota bacterium]PYV29780.1 MAG: ABC transporter [Acidobacteriota bacterium]
MAAIEIEHLTKDFYAGFWRKRPIRALDGLSLRVEAGEIFGFLGPNGAGKTTTLKLLMNLIRPTAGSARILGQPVDSVSMRRNIGYLPENPYFYDHLTPEELLTYIGTLFGIRQPVLRKKILELLETVGLAEARKLQLRKFSKGMVQRVGIAQALINDPEVVFLDEPMSGLDPLGRREVRLVISSLRTRGATVFFSSHILPDVEALCDRVAIMNRGKLLELGALLDILKVKIQGHEIILAHVQPAVLEALRPMCEEITLMSDRVHIRAATSRQAGAIVSQAVSGGAELVSVNPIRASLEEYFFQEVQKS